MPKFNLVGNTFNYEDAPRCSVWGKESKHIEWVGEDGEGTLIIVASLENNEKTINTIPKEYEEVVNYRCVFPINIRKNLINANSPFQTNVSHKRSTLQGQFSFVSNNISPVKGGGGQTYNSTSGKPSGVISVPAARGSTN